MAIHFMAYLRDTMHPAAITSRIIMPIPARTVGISLANMFSGWTISIMASLQCFFTYCFVGADTINDKPLVLAFRATILVGPLVFLYRTVNQ